MRQMSLLAPVAAILLCQALPANAQQERDFPDGPGKEVFVASCGACHELNRARAGYTIQDNILLYGTGGLADGTVKASTAKELRKSAFA